MFHVALVSFCVYYQLASEAAVTFAFVVENGPKMGTPADQRPLRLRATGRDIGRGKPLPMGLRGWQGLAGRRAMQKKSPLNHLSAKGLVGFIICFVIMRCPDKLI